MIGLVLAAGVGMRLRPHTESLPKTLVEIGPDLTILDVILRNLATVGLTDAVVVVGHAADAVARRRAELVARHGVALELLFNDRPQWNNCYSLWLAREALADGALLVNGDTLHPWRVEEELLGRRGAGLALAVDVDRPLTDEAMKVRIGPSGLVSAIGKGMAPAAADGEYIGAALIEAAEAAALTDALERTWRADPTSYYEGAYQLLIDESRGVHAAALPLLSWVEVDDAADLEMARDIACRY